MTALLRYQLYFSMFNGLRGGTIFSNGDLLWVSGELPIVLTTAWAVWGSHGSPLDNNSIQCNSIPVLQALFDKWLCLPHYLISFRLSLYMYIFLEASTALGFHTNPQMTLNFGCHFPPYSIPHPWLLCPSTFDLPVAFPIHPQLSILFPFPTMIYLSSLVIDSMPNLCDFTDYSFIIIDI